MLNLKRCFLGIISFFFIASISAQIPMFQRITYPVSDGTNVFKTPFAGGLNNPQFSAADLNNDGVQDLVVFDRVGDIVLTYINENIPNTSSYTFDPSYACHFPALRDWVLLRDYNNDGAADIFCASIPAGTQEVQVFTGYFENNTLKFKPFKFTYPASCQPCNPLQIWYPDEDMPGFWNNLPISKADIPAIDDADGDGDLDIITFEASVGGHVWLIQNMSVEMGFGLDSLKFRVADKCWGRFYESGVQACINSLSVSPDICANQLQGGVDDREERHPGSTVMTYDQEGDGDLEIVLGDISFDCLNMMTNGGSPAQAWMTAQDVLFPEYDTPVYLPSFPAAFYLDLNNDGKNDMVAAPNSKTIGEDRKGVWYYENTANTGHQFSLMNKKFLVEDMIDFGTSTHPAFADVNGDGLLDLVVGNYGYFTPPSPGVMGTPNNASLYLLLNTGTDQNPQFEISQTNWLNFAEKAPLDFDFAPTFVDIDGDFDLDMLVGSNLGAIYCYRNEGAPGGPMNLIEDTNPMWVSMDAGIASAPAVYDADGDGLLDIILGERQGNINWFKNKGSAFDPNFSAIPDLQNLGAIDTDPPFQSIGFSTPMYINTLQGPMLVCGTSDGFLEAYSGLAASSNPYTLLTDNWGGIDVGARSHPAVADIDNDGILEMVLGNQRGGLSFYKTQLVDCSTTTIKNIASNDAALIVFPSPASQQVRVTLPDAWKNELVQYVVVNQLGQILQQGNTREHNLRIEVANWPTGMYFIEATTPLGKAVAKILVQ